MELLCTGLMYFLLASKRWLLPIWKKQPLKAAAGSKFFHSKFLQPNRHYSGDSNLHLVILISWGRPPGSHAEFLYSPPTPAKPLSNLSQVRETSHYIWNSLHFCTWRWPLLPYSPSLNPKFISILKCKCGKKSFYASVVSGQMLSEFMLWIKYNVVFSFLCATCYTKSIQ